MAFFPSGNGFDLGGIAGTIADALAVREQRKLAQSLGPLAMAGSPARMFPGGIMGGIGRAISTGAMTLRGTITGAIGVIRSATGKILRVIMPGGRSVSRKNAVALIKRVGIDAAAVALGISAVEAAQMLLDDVTTKRRGRGLSAANIRTAKRVCRTISSMQRSLAECARPRSVRRLPTHGHRVVAG